MPRPVFEDEILGKAFDSRLTRKALVFLVPHKGPLIVALFATLFTTAANLVPPYLYGVAIDQGIGSAKMGNYRRSLPVRAVLLGDIRSLLGLSSNPGADSVDSQPARHIRYSPYAVSAPHPAVPGVLRQYNGGQTDIEDCRAMLAS